MQQQNQTPTHQDARNRRINSSRRSHHEPKRHRITGWTLSFQDILPKNLGFTPYDLKSLFCKGLRGISWNLWDFLFVSFSA